MPNETEETSLYQLFHPQFSRNTLPSPPFPKLSLYKVETIFPAIICPIKHDQSQWRNCPVPNAEKQFLTGADTVTRPHKHKGVLPPPGRAETLLEVTVTLREELGLLFYFLKLNFPPARPSRFRGERSGREGREPGSGHRDRAGSPEGRKRSREGKQTQPSAERRTRGGRRAENK